MVWIHPMASPVSRLSFMPLNAAATRLQASSWRLQRAAIPLSLCLIVRWSQLLPQQGGEVTTLVLHNFLLISKELFGGALYKNAIGDTQSNVRDFSRSLAIPNITHRAV
jgi:hypothetical protein